jgi:hypothetical protein
MFVGSLDLGVKAGGEKVCGGLKVGTLTYTERGDGS